MMHKHGNVGSPVAQRGKMYGDDVQAEIKVLAEGAVAISGFQVAIGGGDNAYVDCDVRIAAYWPNFLLLQDAQELGLHFERQLANFIEEDCAAVGGLKETGFCFYGSGEGAFFVAEEFALHQSRDQRTAVYGHKRRLRHGAAKMNRA